MDFDNTEFLRPLVNGWIGKIEASRRSRSKWQEIAKECTMFYSKSAAAMWDSSYQKKFWKGVPAPRFRVTCLVADTPIAMADGTEKPIQDIKVGDVVVTHTGKARKVLRTYSRSFTGEMAKVTLAGYPHPLVMTDDHKMGVFDGWHLSWIESKDLNIGDNLILGPRANNDRTATFLDIKKILGDTALDLDEVILGNGSLSNVSINTDSARHLRSKHKYSQVGICGRVKLPRSQVASALFKRVPICPSLGRLLGWYLAEGCCSSRKVIFTLNSNEMHYATEIVALIKGLFGVDAYIWKSPTSSANVIRVFCGNKNLIKVFSELCPGKANDKRVPAFIFSADKETRIAVLKAWLEGDGSATYCKRAKGSPLTQISGVTVSPGLARDMEALARSCGIPAKTYLYKSSGPKVIIDRVCNTSDRYTVNLYGEKAISLFPALVAVRAGVREKKQRNVSNACPFGECRPIKSIERYHVDNLMVYDFEVEEDHSFVANGIISSNCNKAFEMVAIFGPNLIWDVPHRTVTPKKQLDIPIQLFGDPNDPQVQAFYQQTMAQNSHESLVDKIIAHLMQTWLNYTPREMPGGGLESQSLLAVTDALIKGRGVLWTKPYSFPASGRVLTGCFREPPENLFIDPDYTTLDDAKWIALRKVAPTWEVERRFQLPKGSLHKRSTLESSWAEAEFRSEGDDYISKKMAGQTNDMMIYYEVWSKTGPGTRLTGMELPIKDHLEKTVGDYAWIVVSPNVPYPLNCPSQKLRDGISTDEVRRKFEWPIPCWADDRWPVEVVDFYPDPESAWPVAPLAPALGELKFLNVMIPHLMNRIWSSSRDFWAVIQPAYNDFVRHLKQGADQTVFPINPAFGNKISDVVSVLQQPQTNMDVWRIIEAVSEVFDKRTGLTDFMYGKNESGTQDRTAETTLARKNAAGVRPKYMSRVVTKWQSKAAALEAFCSRLFVTGKDVEPLLGQVGRQMWEAFVMSTDIERVSRQMGYSVAASSIRMPNKDRDIANINQMLSIWLPIAKDVAMQGGDYDPVNEMIRLWGEAADQNVEGIELKPPQPDPQQQQMQQQQLQLEMQKLQADIEKAKMDLQGKQVDIQAKMVDAQLKQQTTQTNLQGQQAKIQADILAKRMDLQFDKLKASQDLRQDQQQHILDMLQSRQEFEQKLEQERELNAIKVKMAKAGKNGK